MGNADTIRQQLFKDEAAEKSLRLLNKLTGDVSSD